MGAEDAKAYGIIDAVLSTRESIELP